MKTETRGRKPLHIGEFRKVMAFAIRPETLRKINAEAERRKISRGMLLDQMFEKMSDPDDFLK